MSRYYFQHLALLAATTTMVSCLSHPATRAGDAHLAADEPARAAAAYKHGLQQGIDSESERDHVEQKLASIEESFVDKYVEARLSEARGGDVDAALLISENDGWGHEATLDEAEAILLERLERKLMKPESSRLTTSQVRHISTLPRLEDKAGQLGRNVLRKSIDGLANIGVTSEAVASLEALKVHPGWQIRALPDDLTSEFIKAGDAVLERLDPRADFELFTRIRKKRGFGHRPWDERAASVIDSRVRAATTSANAQALNSQFAAARMTLETVSKELPLTAEQQARVDREWRRIADRRGNELLRLARDNSNAPATAYVYAALANYYGVAGAEAVKKRYGQRFLGRPLRLESVRIEPNIRRSGDCTMPFAPSSKIVGAGSGTQKVARVTVNLYCGISLDVEASLAGEKTETSSEYVTTETSESTYEYCKRNHSSSADIGRCTMYMDSRSAAENESTLTDSTTERVITDSWTTISVELTGELEVEFLWSVILEFEGKRTIVSEFDRTTTSPISKTGTTRRRFNPRTRQAEYSPPQVFFGLPASSSVKWDPRTGQLTTKVGTEEYATRGELVRGYASAVERVQKTVVARNDRETKTALDAANQNLERARQANDNDAVLAVLLRISMLRAGRTFQAAAFSQLSKGEQELFKFTVEPLSAIQAGIAGESVAPGRGEPIPLADTTWEGPRRARFEAAESVSREWIVGRYVGAEHDVSPWRSTGLNQHIELGPVAEEKGSSVVEVSAYAQGMPLEGAEIASILAGRLTILGTSLEAGFALRPFELTQVKGFDIALRHTLRFEGSSSDPKPVPYFGVAYRQLQGESDSDATNPTPQDTGFRFLGAEAGFALPFGQWLSFDVGTEWNLLWAVDLFDDEPAGEFNPMSPLHGGFTVYASSFYLHARGIYWLHAPDDLSPVGWRFQAGARF